MECDKDSEFFGPFKTKLALTLLLARLNVLNFDVAVSSDLYLVIVQILGGACGIFVCTHLSNGTGSKSTINNWLRFK